MLLYVFFFFKQKTAYEMRISDWSSDVCSSDLFPAEWLGFSFGQLEYLWTLSGMFLVLVCINGAFKYVINVYRGQLGERMLRRLRYELYSRVRIGRASRRERVCQYG